MNNNILEIRNEILNLVNDYSNINFIKKDFIPGVSEVPVSGKVIGTLELQHMVSASLDGWLTTGRFNEQFEKNKTTVEEETHGYGEWLKSDNDLPDNQHIHFSQMGAEIERKKQFRTFYSLNSQMELSKRTENEPSYKRSL